MKKKTTVVLAAVLFLITAILGLGAGSYSSSSAVWDLKPDSKKEKTEVRQSADTGF